MSEATKEKLRQAKIGRKLSPEARAKLSAAHKGKSYPRKAQKGHPVSEATKEKIRQANLGKRATENTKAKMSASRKGVPRPAGCGEHISETNRNQDLPGYRKRQEATSRSNVLRHLRGDDFNVKGYHTSAKAGDKPIPYRSRLIELHLMQMLDADPAVTAWQSPAIVHYIGPTGAKKHALPDFLVVYADGHREMIEGKGSHLVARYMAGEKFKAVKNWCLANAMGFRLAVAKNRKQGLRWEDIVKCP
jgi:hypothetical protein